MRACKARGLAYFALVGPLDGLSNRQPGLGSQVSLVLHMTALNQGSRAAEDC